MTFAYMPYWKKVDAKVEGASQRIQEDCMNFVTCEDENVTSVTCSYCCATLGVCND